MAKNYNTRTASLKATIADVRVLDAKKMNLDGKNILDYISDSEFDSYDTRDPQLKNDELDIWNTAISLSDNGHIEVKPLEHNTVTISSTQSTTIKSAVKVIDNEVLGADDAHLMYWQTDGLTYSVGTFTDCINLTSFNSDLSSLTDAAEMFMACTNLTTFSSDLSSLMGGYCMFKMCTNLTSFNSDLSSLVDGSQMFGNCTNLTTFNSNLSSLTNGDRMFDFTKLDAPSVSNIVHTLPTHETSGGIVIGIGCDDTEADKLLFAQECDCETWQELLDDFSAKNWTVTFQCNGRPTT